MSPKLDGDLELRLRTNSKFSNFYYGHKGLKAKLAKIILNFLNFIKVSEFNERIIINESRYFFYTKE